MSRIGKQPIIIPEGTQVTIQDGVVSVKGKGGELRKKIHHDIEIKVEESNVVVTPVNDSHQALALWGTFASHVRNMLEI